MKTKKMIFGVMLIAAVVMCTVNMQNNLKAANELGFNSLKDLVSLNSASAEWVPYESMCSGDTCPVWDSDFNLWLNTMQVDGGWYCCGAVDTSPGDEYL